MSAFSFLHGASLPEDLCARAAELGLKALALCDRDGVAGIPRFHYAARAHGIKPIVATSVLVATSSLTARVALYPQDRAAYRSLCRTLTTARLSADREQVRDHGLVVSLEALREFAAHRSASVLLAEGTFARAVRAKDPRASQFAAEIAATFQHNETHLERRRTLDRWTHLTDARMGDLAEQLKLPSIATAAARAASASQVTVMDVFDCARLRTTLDRAGRALEPNAERRLKSPGELRTLFYDVSAARKAAESLAERCEYALEDLGYRFPEVSLLPGETEQQRLEHLTWLGAQERYAALTPRITQQLRHELETIAKLSLAGYFLIVWDIVRFCRERGILVQGRGSAANSAVCYSLGITAVDPIGMELLFERFLSEARGDWPDIDLDLPSGDHREQVIQYVYRRYGERCAAMTANVITYRSRSACREVGKALGFDESLLGAVSKQLGYWGSLREDEMSERFALAGVSPHDAKVKHWIRTAVQLQNLPRHLGQHPGGMVLGAGRLDELCPLEPAAMPGRVIVPWDKDDCENLGILKVDLLGLGMMALFERALPLVSRHDGVDLDLAHLPPDDPQTYAMMQRADTVGVFQIESRAQMNTLPRMKPVCFYDLVVEVAIIRPGPIVGKMVNPYLNRRAGKEPVTYPHPSLEPVLARTLGIPLFQEQLMRVAMIAANFTGGQAEELRRAMGSKRSVERMEALEAKLREGMSRNGYSQQAQDDVVRGIMGFALYGFPESHSASFALLAYASAYLKCHFHASFTCALLDCWPMGFYSPATVIQDSRRHGVHVLPIDVTESDWLCQRVGRDMVRLGLRYVRGLRQLAAKRIVDQREQMPFASVSDFAARTKLSNTEINNLAQLGALNALPSKHSAQPLTRRTALWQVLALSQLRDTELFASVELPQVQSPLDEMTLAERIAADFRHSSVTVGQHPVALARHLLKSQGVVTIEQVQQSHHHQSVSVAGSVITRQKPPAAKGFFFLTIEDESGVLNAIVDPKTFEAQRAAMVSEPLLILHGVVQRQDGAVSLKVARVDTFALRETIRTGESHDFR